MRIALGGLQRLTLRSVLCQALGTTMLASLSLTSPVLAQDLFWDAGADGNDPTVITGGDGDWNTTDPVWSDAAANTSFTNGASVSFGPGAPDPYTVTITEPGGLSVNEILFSSNVNLVSSSPATLSVTGPLTADASVSIEDSIAIATPLAVTGTGEVTIHGDIAGGLSSDVARLSLNGNTGGIEVFGGQVTAHAGQSTSLTSTGGQIVVEEGRLVSGPTQVTGGSVTVAGGTLAGATTVDSGGTLDIQTGTLAALANAGSTLMTGGQIDGAVSNTGTLNLLGGSAGTVQNSGHLVLQYTEIDELVNRDGQAELYIGEVRGSTTVEGGIVYVYDVSLVGPTTIRDGATMDVESGFGRTTSTITVEQGGTFEWAGLTAGDILNDGTTSVSFGEVGDITNGTDPATAADAILNLSTATTGAVTNNGGRINVSGTILESLNNVQGDTVLYGDLRVDGPVRVSGGSLHVFESSTFIQGPVTTSGTAAFYLGESYYASGPPSLETVTLRGSGEHSIRKASVDTLVIETDVRIRSLNALNPVRVNSGTTEIFHDGRAPTIAGGLVANNATLVLTIWEESTHPLISEVLELQDNVAVTMSGTGTLNGVRSSGSGNSFSLSNASASDIVTISGDATTSGTTFLLDVDLSHATQSADRLIFEGLREGETVSVMLRNLGETGKADGTLTPIVVNTPTAVIEADLSALNASSPFLDYTLMTEDNLTYALQSGASQDVMAIGAGFAATQSLIGAIVSRPEAPPTTPRDARRAPEALCGYGGWGRLTGGDLESETGFRSDTTRGTLPTDLDYAGVQLGADMACLNDRFGGWDLTLGGFLGFNSGQAETRSMAGASLTRTEFDQSYAGLYLVAERGPLFADLQLRYEDMGFDVETGGGSELDLDTRYDATAVTLSGAIGYQWQVPGIAGLSVTPRAGFSLSCSETDQIRLSDEAVLEIDESDQQRAFAGLTLARSFDPGSAVGALNLFGSLIYHADLSDGYDATLLSPEASEFQVDGIGDYTELSAGVSFARVFGAERAGPTRALNAALRVDALSGESVDGWGLTGEIRFKF